MVFDIYEDVSLLDTAVQNMVQVHTINTQYIRVYETRIWEDVDSV